MKDNTIAFFIDELESPFVKKELNHLSVNFKKVIVVSSKPITLSAEYNNTSAVLIEYDHYSASSILKQNFFLIISVALKEFFFSINYLFRFGLFKNKVSEFIRSIHLANEIEKKIITKLPSQTIYYSFWFNQWATALALLTKKNKLNGTAITRAHGTDLFEDRVPILKRIAFRWFQLKYISSVFSVSKKGTNYLKNKYPAFSQKIVTSYLGTDEYGKNPFDDKAIFTIVSCAKIRNIKRIHLIPQILEHLDFPVKWIHIGTEDKNDPTITLLHKNLSLLQKNKTNVQVQFIGEMPNAEVLKFYSSHSINLFVSVSETEGLPVSMMEAISFGIPVMATDVGGCSEIVNEQTGFLVPKEFDFKETAKRISDFSISQNNTSGFRGRISEYWKNNFNSDFNFTRFLQTIQH